MPPPQFVCRHVEQDRGEAVLTQVLRLLEVQSSRRARHSDMARISAKPWGSRRCSWSGYRPDAAIETPYRVVHVHDVQVRVRSETAGGLSTSPCHTDPEHEHSHAITVTRCSVEQFDDDLLLGLGLGGSGATAPGRPPARDQTRSSRGRSRGEDQRRQPTTLRPRPSTGCAPPDATA